MGKLPASEFQKSRMKKSREVIARSVARDKKPETGTNRVPRKPSPKYPS